MELAYWSEARRHLQLADPTLADIIQNAGESVLQPRNDPFFSLSRSIVGQQVSAGAAGTIWRRLIAATGEITPNAISDQSEESLHRCGLSRRKAQYLLNLADHFVQGGFDAASWDEMDDEKVIERLVLINGIGRWTAEMFLIFHLMRPDVLPVTDIGIQRAMARHFNEGVRPNPEEMREISAPWKPWRSVASWYLWRSLDPVPVEY